MDSDEAGSEPETERKCKICGDTRPLSCFNKMGQYTSRKTGVARERWRPECRDCTIKLNHPERLIKKATVGKSEVHILKTRTCNRMRLELGRMNTAECRALLGCTWPRLADHLMKRLYEGEDVRAFELDHIQPLKNFDIKADKEAREHLFNWKNLQLLTKEEHAAKTARERAIRMPTGVPTAVTEPTWLPPAYVLVPTPAQPYPVGSQADIRAWLH